MHSGGYSESRYEEGRPFSKCLVKRSSFPILVKLLHAQRIVQYRAYFPEFKKRGTDGTCSG